MKRLFGALFAIFVILNVVDVFNTQWLLIFSDKFVEVGPLQHWLLEKVGSTLILWLPKIILLLLVGSLCNMTVGTKYEDLWKRILICGCWFTGCVDLYSTALIFTS